jgi:prephenate dehydrogenase
VTEHRRAAVIGLGLIGGSIARDLHARGVAVSAYDVNPRDLEAAARDGVIDRALDANLSGIEDAELVVIAVPVDAAPGVLAQVARAAHSATLVTDVGSTKSRIVAAAGALGIGDRFVGSHPMAGSHESGWRASRTGLFREARVYVCPTPNASMSVIRAANELWLELGARPTLIGPAQHDERLAWTSHMPQMVAGCLALALARAGVVRDELGRGGMDMTRLAGSSPAMWTGIALENVRALDEALAAAEGELAALRGLLARGDAADLRQRFVAAREWFEGRPAD